mgnify:CR=1 FL=1
MIVIHPQDPSTAFLTALYEGRSDVDARLDEQTPNSQLMKSLRGARNVMMLGHGYKDGLYAFPLSDSARLRRIINANHVQFLRDKTCIGIWCYASHFATRYHLRGLFSGMIISEMQEATQNGVPTTEYELEQESHKFAERLRFCLDHYPLSEVPARFRLMDDVHSPLTEFNYQRLFFF